MSNLEVLLLFTTCKDLSLKKSTAKDCFVTYLYEENFEYTLLLFPGAVDGATSGNCIFRNVDDFGKVIRNAPKFQGDENDLIVLSRNPPTSTTSVIPWTT